MEQARRFRRAYHGTTSRENAKRRSVALALISDCGLKRMRVPDPIDCLPDFPMLSDQLGSVQQVCGSCTRAPATGLLVT